MSSGGYGPVTAKSLAFAFVKPDSASPGTELTVSLFGERRPARVLAEAVRDPENARLRSKPVIEISG